MLKQLGFVFLVIVTSNSRAAWYEVTTVDTASVNQQTARKHALEDAIFQALQFANADIGTLEAIRPYLNESKNHYFFGGNEIREIQIVNEENIKDKVKLAVRIDIYPELDDCHRRLYRKKILLSDFTIRHPQHASLGKLYKFGRSFTQLLEKQISANSQSLVVQSTSPYTITASNPTAAMMIAEENNAQYLVLGSIIDMTATIDKDDKDENNRQLAVEVKVINAKTGQIMFQNNFRDIARWTFSLSSKIDTQTARFWTSPYGQMAQSMTRNILLKLENQLACHAATPEIIAIDSNNAKMNAGRSQGVKLGDQLTLWHNTAFIDRNGVAQKQLKKSNIQLTVTQVYEDSAELQIHPTSLAASIQIGDFASKGLN